MHLKIDDDAFAQVSQALEHASQSNHHPHCASRKHSMQCSCHVGKAESAVRILRTAATVNCDLFSGLFDDAVAGLREYYPEEMARADMDALRLRVARDFTDSGNLQNDYQTVRSNLEWLLKQQAPSQGG